MGQSVRCISVDGTLAVTAIDGTDIVGRAAEIHKTTAVTSAALGRALCAASLMGSALKGKDDSLTLRINGGGPAGTVMAVSDSEGNVRGYVQQPVVELPLNKLGKLDVASAVGKNGFVTVIKDLGLKDPYVGQTPIVSGEIAEDITAYFAKSEQIPTVCALGVLVGRDYTCLGAGGVLIQLMPGADDDFVTRLEARVPYLDGISHAFSDERTNRERLAAILGDIEFDVFDELECAYRCDCSAERVERALVSLGRGELEKMIADGETIDVNCQFCDKTYHFTTDELKSLYERAK